MKSKKLILSFCMVIVVALTFGFALPALAFNAVTGNAYAATSLSNSTADWTTQYTGNYYNNIDDNANGDELRDQLSTLIGPTNSGGTHHTLTTYKGLSTAFKTTDADPNKNGNIIWFYTGTSVSFSGNFGSSVGSTNREHVWAKHSGSTFDAESGPGADAHHLRPTEMQLNGSRSNYGFGEVTKSVNNRVKENGSTSYGNANDDDTFCYLSGGFFYPSKGYRGATARILMYMQVRWGTSYSLYFVDGQTTSNGKGIGKFSDLLKWHLEEPPTDEEIRRNEAVYKLQGNRNPFIDHPEYAAKIFCYTDGLNNISGTALGNKLQNIVNTYGNYNEEIPDITDIAITPNNALNLTVGATATLNVNVTPANANKSVSWSSSNENVAKVANGVVTATGNGTATITATSNANSAIKASVTVNVKSATGISVSGSPNKTAYNVGERFDPTGLTVTVTYSDGTDVSYSDSSGLSNFEWLDRDTLKPILSPSTTNIVCKYGTFSCVVNGTVSVTASPAVANFSVKVNAIMDLQSLQERFDAINVAIQTYSQLSESDKQQAKDIYDVLVKLVETYNSDVEQCNAALNNASSIAAKAITVTLVAALAMILIPRIRQGGVR